MQIKVGYRIGRSFVHGESPLDKKRKTHHAQSGRCVTPRWVEKGSCITTRKNWQSFAQGCGANWDGHAKGVAPQLQRTMVAWPVADNVRNQGTRVANRKSKRLNSSQ